GQAGSRRAEPEARGRSARDQFGHPGSLRRPAVQARALRRGDRRVDPRPRRRRRLHRSRRHRPEDSRGEAKARQEMRALALAVAAAGSVACGVPLAKLPAGSGVHATDAGAALDQATAACRSIRSLTAEVGVSGSANGHRVRARITAGVAAPASARLEAVAPFGPPLFIFVAPGNDATLLLPRDDRVL